MSLMQITSSILMFGVRFHPHCPFAFPGLALAACYHWMRPLIVVPTVLPPSTTSLSSWKNWLTTVCRYVASQPILLEKTPGILSLELWDRCKFSLQRLAELDPPSSLGDLSVPLKSIPALDARLSLSCTLGKHPAFAVSHTP